MQPLPRPQVHLVVQPAEHGGVRTQVLALPRRPGVVADSRSSSSSRAHPEVGGRLERAHGSAGRAATSRPGRRRGPGTARPRRRRTAWTAPARRRSATGARPPAGSRTPRPRSGRSRRLMRSRHRRCRRRGAPPGSRRAPVTFDRPRSVRSWATVEVVRERLQPDRRVAHGASCSRRDPLARSRLDGVGSAQVQRRQRLGRRPAEHPLAGAPRPAGGGRVRRRSSTDPRPSKTARCSTAPAPTRGAPPAPAARASSAGRSTSGPSARRPSPS